MSIRDLQNDFACLASMEAEAYALGPTAKRGLLWHELAARTRIVIEGLERSAVMFEDNARTAGLRALQDAAHNEKEAKS